MMLPELFASTVRIKVLPDEPVVSGQPDSTASNSTYDPRFSPTQVGIIDSAAVLTRAVEELDLPQVWGKKYYEGQQLKISECVAMLRARLDLRVLTNSSLIDIRVYSDTAPDAATLANAVAKAYQLWRAGNASSQVQNRVKALEQQLALQEQKVERIKGDLASMAEAGEAAPPNSAQKLTYLEKQKNFETELDQRQLLARRINAEKLDLQLPLAARVEIVDSAVPAIKPVRPNVPLNIILSIVMGALFGMTLSGLVYLLQWRAYRRKIGVYGVTHSPGVRNSFRIIIGLLVGIIVGYNCAMPIVGPAGLAVFPLIVVVGGVGLSFVELTNFNPLSPTDPAKIENQKPVFQSKY